jgi:hypothetical protein
MVRKVRTAPYLEAGFTQKRSGRGTITFLWPSKSGADFGLFSFALIRVIRWEKFVSIGGNSWFWPLKKTLKK